MATYTTKAAFILSTDSDVWAWVKWTHNEPSKHTAIIAKAEELNAIRWDFGNADHGASSEWPTWR